MLGLVVAGCHSKPKAQLDSELVEATWNGNEPEVKKLLDEGASPNVVDSNPNQKFNGLGLSVQKPEIVREYLKKGADPNKVDGNGLSPLSYAVTTGTIESLKLLIEGGANLNAKGPLGETILHDAAGAGNLTAVNYLFEKKMDVNAVDGQGGTPLHSCVSAPFANARANEVIKALLKAGADKKIKNKQGKTAFDLMSRPFFANRAGSGELRALLDPSRK